MYSLKPLPECDQISVHSSVVLFQELPNPHHDAPEIQLSNHLPALHDETGETERD